MKLNIFYLLMLMIMASCSKHNLVYFSDLEEQAEYTEKILNRTEPTIQPDDLLSISVSSLNPEANTLFNSGEILSMGSTASDNNIYREGYLVDQDGYIEFPVLGKIQLSGLSKSEAKAKITSELQEYLKEPVVNIRYLNYRITVVGEVSNPSTFIIPSEKMNVLEALGMAGDMTVFGKRENVLIIREEEGVRKMTRLNFNNKDVLNSPYFYLLPNDVVYVEPVKAKAAQANTVRNNISFVLSIASVLTLILTRVL